MTEQENINVTAMDNPPSAEEMAEELCHGTWRLRPNIVVRAEDDGGIIFDPDTDAMGTVNIVGIALLCWRPERICYEEWCEALSNHYKEVDITQIKADMKKFLVDIAYFLEAYDEKKD